MPARSATCAWVIPAARRARRKWSPTNPSVQVSIVSGDPTAPEPSALSVNVSDVDAAYEQARRRGYEIVYPLTHEPWGVRRFFVRDPHGVVVNVVGHPD